MPTAPLNVTVTGVLDGSGNGVLSATPRFGQTWRPTIASTFMSGSIPSDGESSTCVLLIGMNVNAATQIDSTYQVTGAASDSLTGQVVYPGQSVFAQFTNGNPGAAVTMTLTGTFDYVG